MSAKQQAATESKVEPGRFSGLVTDKIIYQPGIANNNQADVQGVMNLHDIRLILMRHTKIITGSIAVAMIVAVLYLLISPALYTAKSVLQVNAQKNNVVSFEAVISGSRPDDAQLQSQIDIMTSRKVAGAVVDELDLVHDPEFSPKISTASLKNWVMQLMNGGNEIVTDDNVNEQKLIRSVTIANVLARLQVAHNRGSYTILAKYTAKSPEKAALIANGFVDAYIKGQLAAKFDATRRANSWLVEKSAELQSKVRDTELLVQAFREKNGLIETSGRTVTEQQLSELNSQLILARTEKAQAEARLSAAGDSDASTDVLKSGLIQNLRAQETEVLRKRSDLSSQYGPKHPKIINVNAELSDLRDKIGLEIKKVKASLVNEVNIAAAREKALQKSLDELQDKSGLSTVAKVKLDELTRERDANKSLYEAFLKRSKETSEGLGMERADAVVVAQAEAPLAPSHPRKLMVLLLALFVGSSVGLAVVMLIEHLDESISSSRQAEEVTGVHNIAMVPELERGVNIINYLKKRPSSVFGEALRGVYAALYFANGQAAPRIVMVTSSLPKEGKSSFVLALAALVAGGGKKVLLIDADMRRPTIARAFKLEFTDGLGELLNGAATVQQVMQKDDTTGVHFIPCQPNTENSQGLLASDAMQELLAEMRGQYDLIIIDTPPVMATADCMVLSTIVDTTLFLVRWQKTPREIVKAAIKQLDTFNVRLAGVVLTRVDMARQSKYSHSDKGNYYKNYSEYYSS